MYQHKHHLLEGFTSKYDVTRLVWYAQGDDIASAISLEKKIKNRNRQWKVNLIEKSNPDWIDLAAGWMDSGPCDCVERGIPREIAESTRHGPCDFAQGDRLCSTQGDGSSSAQNDKGKGA